ncbi:MAG: hypothetical protein GF353_04810 [Candidatus Lokiarchaeota archaeon]|nr:hypothetical protein [Candidatus Lokiarchaeota archaeon]
MNSKLNLQEKSVKKICFPECNGIEVRRDLVFLFPSNFSGNSEEIANTLQAAIIFLKELTSKDSTKELLSKVIIGYNDNSKPDWSYLKGNRIVIPQKYINKEREPLNACSHELIHPFFYVSPLNEINEFWGEGFCDFLRGPLKNFMGLDGNGWWNEKIRQAADNYQDRGGNAAGQLILKACEYCGHNYEWHNLISDLKFIKKFINWLYVRFSHYPMSLEFRATNWIKNKELKHSKGPFGNQF